MEKEEIFHLFKKILFDIDLLNSISLILLNDSEVTTPIYKSLDQHY